MVRSSVFAEHDVVSPQVQMQELVLVNPEGASRLMDMLADPLEIIRNEVHRVRVSFCILF